MESYEAFIEQMKNFDSDDKRKDEVSMEFFNLEFEAIKIGDEIDRLKKVAEWFKNNIKTLKKEMSEVNDCNQHAMQEAQVRLVEALLGITRFEDEINKIKSRMEIQETKLDALDAKNDLQATKIEIGEMKEKLQEQKVVLESLEDCVKILYDTFKMAENEIFGIPDEEDVDDEEMPTYAEMGLTYLVETNQNYDSLTPEQKKSKDQDNAEIMRILTQF